ncbi:MAG: polysaccharide biosynthesis tyrosine autokinase [Verrucomicrobiae bacterium]|nr:polysaccharide biosynthesis tyrosine autokinase [Verrucomicrobiae bacterium]
MEATTTTYTANQPIETKLHFLDYWRIIRVRKAVIIPFFLLVVVTATLVTYFMPETYSSTARIEVEKDIPDVDTFQMRQYIQPYDPFFITTQFEIIQSKTILYRVIEKLDLNRRWARRLGLDNLRTDETFLLLKRQLKLSQTRNTSLIEITVYIEGEENKNEAAEIANAIAEAYKEYRLETRLETTQRGLKALQDELKRIEDEVKDKEKTVEKLRQQLNVAEIDPMTGRSSGSLDDETLRRMEALRSEAEADYIQWKTLYENLTNMTRAELKRSIVRAKEDIVLTGLIEQLAQAEQKKASLEPDLGPENVELQKVNKLIETLNNQIEEQLSGMLEGLKVRVVSLEARYKELDTKVNEARKRNIMNAEKFRPFVSAKEDLDTTKKLRESLTYRVSTEMLNLKVPYSSIVKIVDRAEPGKKPVLPNKVLNISLGVIFGLILGIGLAFFIEYLDTSVKTIDDVERALQAPVLAVIPQNVSSLLDEGPDSSHAEAYRVLRTNILFSRKNPKANTLAVVSAGAGEGKSTTIFNLAVIFAQNGHRILLVDSDLRRPSLHKILRVSNSIGLTNYLLNQKTLEEVIQTTPQEGLDFLPSGKLPSSSMGILSSPKMKELVAELRQRYDYVFFDSPPIMGVSDASVLASLVDMTIQVIQYRRYPQPMTIRCKQMVEKVGGNLVGIVLNNITMTSDASYYYYYGGYYHDSYNKVADDQIIKSKPSSKDSKKETEKSKDAKSEEVSIKQKY